MLRSVLATLVLTLLATSTLAQESRERSDRDLKDGLEGSQLDESQVSAAMQVVSGLVAAQARACEQRGGARDEDYVDFLVSEVLTQRLDAAGIPSSAQRNLMAVAFGRLTELGEAADLRDEAEGGLKEALSSSSLTDEEMTLALGDLVRSAESSGPALLRRAEEIAALENENVLPGLEVEPDPTPLVLEHLAESFEGRGLSSGELEELVEPFVQLIETRREMMDAMRFAGGSSAQRPSGKGDAPPSSER